MEHFDSIINELKSDFETIAQGKSDFVLEHLIVGQEDTPVMQWVQCLQELKARYFAIANLMLDIKEAEQKQRLHRFLESVTFGLFGNARRQELRVENLQLSIDGLYGEFNALLRLYKQMPRLTREQIEAGQYEYWKRRLSKQAFFDIVARGAIQQGNMEGLRQIKAVSDHPGMLFGKVNFDFGKMPTVEERFKELLEANNAKR